MQHYFIIYKPYLVLSQFSASAGKQTLADFFDVPSDVYPVGRLDHDSEGLLILTNDGSVNHRLLAPSFAHEREYYVQVDGPVTQEALLRLSQGVCITVNGTPYTTKQARAFLMEQPPVVPERNPPIRFRQFIPAPWISVTLKEGKNRQVRKMTAAVGFPTLRLIRYRIAQLNLHNMQPGEIVALSKTTLYKKLFNQ